MECPLCKTELEVTFDYGGLVVQCPVCSDYFKIPSVKECPQCLKRSFAKRDVCEECGYDFAAVEELIEKGSVSQFFYGMRVPDCFRRGRWWRFSFLWHFWSLRVS